MTVIAGRAGCPSCSKSGFNPKEDAFIYLLASQCRRFFKVGLTNKAKRRITELRRSTPFEIDLIFTHKSDGESILSLEKQMHSKFKSANFSGFNGATEWFLWDENILTVFKQLSHP